METQPKVRKVPQIRQTKASLYRIVKANPYLRMDTEEAKLEAKKLGLSNLKLPQAVLEPRTKIIPDLDDGSFIVQPVIPKKLIKPNKPLVRPIKNHILPVNIPKREPNRVAVIPPKQPKRSSLSSNYYERKRVVSKGQPQSNVQVNATNKDVKSVTFTTPTAVVTPTMHRNYRATPYHSLSKPNETNLTEHLNKWLKKRNISAEEYRHLNCFGVSKDNNLDVENKENRGDNNEPLNTSYEDLHILSPIKESSPVSLDNAKPATEQDLKFIARDALINLHELIVQGYPGKQCEAWLTMIGQKYNDLDEESEYWECRAAIEQNRGNFTTAVECYRAAVVHGAEADAVDQCLETLLEKFCLLNIDAEHAKKDKNRTKILHDARNMFKSSIIQFAVQERLIKKNETSQQPLDKKYLVTPVRRSTRKNRKSYVLTPGVQVCSSLKEIDNIRPDILFSTNRAII